MKVDLYLMMAFIWKYKETLCEANELSLDESIYIANEIVKDYLASDDYVPQDTAEVDEFLEYVERNLTDYID